MVAQHGGQVGQREGDTPLAQICVHRIARGDRACFAPHAPQGSPFALVRLCWGTRERRQRRSLGAAIEAAFPTAMMTKPRA